MEAAMGRRGRNSSFRARRDFPRFRSYPQKITTSCWTDRKAPIGGTKDFDSGKRLTRHRRLPPGERRYSAEDAQFHDQAVRPAEAPFPVTASSSRSPVDRRGLILAATPRRLSSRRSGKPSLRRRRRIWRASRGGLIAKAENGWRDRIVSRHPAFVRSRNACSREIGAAA